LSAVHGLVPPYLVLPSVSNRLPFISQLYTGIRPLSSTSFRPTIDHWEPICYTEGEADTDSSRRGNSMAEGEFWTVRQAREYLAISKKKMAQLIKDGVLATKDSVLDKRVKMVRRQEVEALKAGSAQAEAPRKDAA
jgi:hypothetical protein